MAFESATKRQQELAKSLLSGCTMPTSNLDHTTSQHSSFGCARHVTWLNSTRAGFSRSMAITPPTFTISFGKRLALTVTKSELSLRRNPTQSHECCYRPEIGTSTRGNRSYPDQHTWTGIKTNLSFRQATSDDIISLFQMHCHGTEPLFYKSPTGLSSVITRGYRERVQEVKYVLNSATTGIHISCDLWTSTNLLSLLGVVSHFSDSHHIKRTILLGVPRV